MTGLPLLGRTSVLALALIAIVAACTGSPGSAGASVPPSPSTSTSASASATVWPVPAELLDRVVAMAAAASFVDPAKIVVVSAEPVTWDNGALGCPKLGVMYTQGLVQGYRVVVSADGRELDYRAGGSGEPRPCEKLGPAGGAGG